MKEGIFHKLVQPRSFYLGALTLQGEWEVMYMCIYVYRFLLCFYDFRIGIWSCHGEVYSIQHYVIKFVSDLRQVGGFLRLPPPIKLTATT